MLELRDISAGYETGLVLHKVNVVVPDGAVVALLGPNGAGKTTLLRIASGILRPESGQVLVDGQDVTGASPHRLARLGVCHVPEGRGIFRSLTVADNLRLQAPRAIDRKATDEIAETFPVLADRRHQLAGDLSGGEQQMLALSRAYLSAPKHVLLDEVSMGLAPIVVGEIFSYLRRLAQTGTSQLLVEQYAKTALEMADYVYLLVRGKIVFSGTPDDISAEDVASSYLGSGISGTQVQMGGTK